MRLLSTRFCIISAVLFDLDNTLIDRDRAFRECVESQFTDTTVRARLLALDNSGYGNREALLSTWSLAAGHRVTALDVGSWIAERLQPQPTLLRSLKGLSQQFKLGVITNGAGQTQRRKIENAGLNSVIPADHFWISEEIGISKPNPDLFLLAIKKMRLLPRNCLFVGDQSEMDIAGARAAGLRAVQVSMPLDGEQLDEIIQAELLR
jgi:putative hydrolase of the HAD superfamily